MSYKKSVDSVNEFNAKIKSNANGGIEVCETSKGQNYASKEIEGTKDVSNVPKFLEENVKAIFKEAIPEKVMNEELEEDEAITDAPSKPEVEKKVKIKVKYAVKVKNENEGGKKKHNKNGKKDANKRHNYDFGTDAVRK